MCDIASLEPGSILGYYRNMAVSVKAAYVPRTVVILIFMWLQTSKNIYI